MGLLGKSKQPKREPNKAEMLRDAAETLLDAAKRGDLATLKRLVEEGVDLEARGEYYESALMKAAEAGNLDCLEHLVTKRAKLEATNKVSAAPPAAPQPAPPLALCLRHHLPPPIVRVCAAAAASRQSQRTALHSAADNGHAPCVEALLKAGADARLKNDVSDGAEG